MTNVLNNERLLNNKPKNNLSNYNQYRYYKKIRKDGFNRYQIVPYSRRLAVKYYCLECVGYEVDEIKTCSESDCQLYPYRLSKIPKKLTSYDRSKAIRSFCKDCCSGDQDFITWCPSKLCPVYPYRLAGYKTDTETLIPFDRIKSLA